MASHGLPSLATLRLGASTGMPSTDADGKRPVKASRAEESPAAPPVAPPPQAQPEMLLLTHLPRDVIGKIVTQAALDALRTSLNPASEICAWMKRFCTAARMQGVAGCDDHWYKLALVAFGVDPDAVDAAPPKWMRGDTKLKKNAQLSWREFFGSVCDVFELSSWDEINKYFPKLMNTWSVTQRDLDEELRRMFYDFAAWINRTHHPGAGLDTKGTMPIVKADWNTLMRGVYPEYLFSYDLWPLMGLLLLRGAEPWTTAKYDALDHEVYVAIMATKGDALSAPERLSTDEAIRRIADAVARGASTTVAIKSLERRQIVLSLTAALEVNNPAIIRWLLDHGARVGQHGVGKPTKLRWQYAYVRQLITKTVYDVDEWQVGMDTTEELMAEAVSFFESAKDKDQNLFSMGRDILNTTLEHMEDNGFQGNDQSSESMDIGPLIPASQIPEDDSSDTNKAYVKELIYNSWKSIYDDEYGGA